MRFEDLRLAEPLLRALIQQGYATPTPIQAKAIPHVMQGCDLLGCAQTGTGKTAAFALPMLQRLSQPAGANAAGQGDSQRHPHEKSTRGVRSLRGLILAPTRELAAQISDSFADYGRHLHLRHAVIFGGVNQNPQVRALREGLDILVATPGRLLDLMNQGFVDLRSVEVFVLDEADRMLDMGFINDIRKIAARLPGTGKRQTLLFSATMPQEIRSLASSLLHQPVYVEVAPVSATADRIDQFVYFVDKKLKTQLLVHLLEKTSYTRTLVFTRTKHGADRVARQLFRSGIRAEAIHGNKSQNARVRALDNFKSGKTSVLIASDIAARGIDIDDISHVFNFDLPNVPETYVHRIGRTGRAGASGVAIAFCDQEERAFLKSIERLTRVQLTVCDDHPVYSKAAERGTHPVADEAASTSTSNHRPAQGQNGNASSSRRPRNAGNGQSPANNGGQGGRSGRRSGRGPATSSSSSPAAATSRNANQAAGQGAVAGGQPTVTVASSTATTAGASAAARTLGQFRSKSRRHR